MFQNVFQGSNRVKVRRDPSTEPTSVILSRGSLYVKPPLYSVNMNAKPSSSAVLRLLLFAAQDLCH